MPYIFRAALALAGASLLVAWRAQSAPDVVEVVISNGPHAGTYKTPSDETICMRHKDLNFHAATWRDATIHDPKILSSAAIQVARSDKAGPKHGEVRVAFGDRSKADPDFLVKEAPVTMTLKGKGGEFSFEGTVKGIKIKVTGRCAVIEEV